MSPSEMWGCRGLIVKNGFGYEQAFVWPMPGLSVEELLAAKGTQPLTSAADLAADTFSSDTELEEFLAFTAAERHRDLA